MATRNKIPLIPPDSSIDIAAGQTLTVPSNASVANTNTGDQDLSAYLLSATAASTYEPIKGADDNYVTDAQLVVIGNTSGTNTGDNATNTQYSGLAASKQDTLVSATNIKTVNGVTLLGAGDLAVSVNSIVGITGTVAQFNTALTDGNFATGGGTATGTNTGDDAVNTNYGYLVPQQTIIASSATPTPTGGSRYNELYVLNQSDNAVIAAPTSGPSNGNTLIIRILSTGTYTLGFNAIYEAVGVTLPTGITPNKEIYIGAKYNSAALKWQVLAVSVKA